MTTPNPLAPNSEAMNIEHQNADIAFHSTYKTFANIWLM